MLLEGGNPSFPRSTSLCLPGQKATVTCFTEKQTPSLEAHKSVWLVCAFQDALVGALRSFRHFLPLTGGSALILCHASAYGL